MSLNPPIPLEDAPEIPDTFVSHVAGGGIDGNIVMVMLAADRFRLDTTASAFRRICARLVMTEDTARDLIATLQTYVATAEKFRTQSSNPN
jgi:hypothetical protein